MALVSGVEVFGVLGVEVFGVSGSGVFGVSGFGVFGFSRRGSSGFRVLGFSGLGSVEVSADSQEIDACAATIYHQPSRKDQIVDFSF